MPTGSRRTGSASGPAGNPPRLYFDGAGSAAPAVGQVFAPDGRDTLSKRSDPVAVGASRAVIEFGPVPSDQVWKVERISVNTSSSSATTAKVYLGSIEPGNIVDQTINGDGDVADQINPIVVPGSTKLLIAWVGNSDGSQAFANIQIQTGHYETAAI